MALAVGVKIIPVWYRLYSNGVEHYWVGLVEKGRKDTTMRGFELYIDYTHPIHIIVFTCLAFRWRGRLVGGDVNYGRRSTCGESILSTTAACIMTIMDRWTAKDYY